MNNFLFEDHIDGGFFFVQCDTVDEAYEIILEEIASAHPCCDRDTLMMDYDKEDREIFEDFKKEINMDAKCDSWEEFKSIVSCMLDSIRERHYRKFVKPEDVEVRWDEGKIFIKKGRYFIAHVDITTAFWSDLEVLGKLLSKHSVEEVANIVNELECPYALSSALAE